MKNNSLKILLLLAVGFFLSGSVYSQPTGFTYQGILKTGDTPANGQFDFTVKLFNVAGTQLGNTNNFANITVTNGLYTLVLDFGANFTGGDRFLEIGVKQTGTAQFTTLSPRVPILSSPYAYRSYWALNAVSATTAASADTAIDAQQLDGIDSTGFLRNQTTTQTANFAVSGTGAANILNAFTQFNIGGQRVLSAPSSQNTFVGIGAGQNNGSGFSNTFVGSNAGQGNQSGDENSFFGMNAGTATTGNLNTFVGRGAGVTNGAGSSNTILGANANVETAALTNATAIGAGAIVTFSDTIQLGRHTLDSVRIGRLGSGGSTAVCLNGVNGFATCSSSIRYKSNINQFVSGLSLIRSLRPVSFRWRADDKDDLGLVAEEVADVEPLLVTRNEKGEVEGVKYDRVGVIVVNAVKEQQIQIEAQQKQIEMQQKRMDKQLEAIDQLSEKLGKQQSELEALKRLIFSVLEPDAMCRPGIKER
jgi:hypothetical protein